MLDGSVDSRLVLEDKLCLAEIFAKDLKAVASPVLSLGSALHSHVLNLGAQAEANKG